MPMVGRNLGWSAEECVEVEAKRTKAVNTSEEGTISRHGEARNWIPAYSKTMFKQKIRNPQFLV